MKKFLVLIICVIICMSSCAKKLNPKWYPNGVGKDTVYIVGDGKFCLAKTSAGIDLSMHRDNGETGVLLAFVNQYKMENDKLFVLADEGYCIVDESQNTARILITVEKQYFSNLVGDDEAITYLTSFEFFSQEEQEIFNKMKK